MNKYKFFLVVIEGQVKKITYTTENELRTAQVALNEVGFTLSFWEQHSAKQETQVTEF